MAGALRPEQLLELQQQQQQQQQQHAALQMLLGQQAYMQVRQSRGSKQPDMAV